MPRKTTSNASPATVQLGLAAALGDGKTSTVLTTNLPIASLGGRITQKENRYEKDEWEAFLQSIREGGLEQPIIVRPTPGPGGVIMCEIVEGRHRVLAFEQLRLPEIPCLVRSDYDARAAAMAEFTTNHQRKASTPLEQARAFGAAREAGLTVNEIATRAGISASTVGLRLKLLDLPGDVAAHCEELRQDDLETLAALAKDPDLAGPAMAAARKTLKDGNTWRIADDAVRALEEKGLVAIPSDYEVMRATGAHEDPKAKKRLNKIPRVKFGNLEVTKDVATFKATVEELVEAKKAREKDDAKAAGGKKRGATVEQRATVRMPDAQRDLALKRAKGLVDWNDELQCCLAATMYSRHHAALYGEADQAALAEILGDAHKGLKATLQFGEVKAEKFQAWWKKNRAAANQFLCFLLFAENRTHHHVQYGAAMKNVLILDEDDFCKLLTGKTNKDTLAACKEAVREELAAKGKGKKASKRAPRGGSRRNEPPGREEDDGQDDVDEAEAHLDDLAEGAAAGPDVEADLEA